MSSNTRFNIRAFKKILNTNNFHLLITKISKLPYYINILLLKLCATTQDIQISSNF